MRRTNFLPGDFSSHFPRSRKEEQEFGKPHEGLVLCKNCDGAFFKKSWHHRADLHLSLEEENKATFKLCPACQMEKDKKFEGEIHISDIPKEKWIDFKNTILNSGDLGRKRDPEDRILTLEESFKEGKIHITTSENQLAIEIAKKLESSFGAKTEIITSREESIVRINIQL